MSSGTNDPTERQRRSPDADAGWIAAVEKHYAPAPLDGVGGARFHARLRARLEAESPHRRLRSSPRGRRGLVWITAPVLGTLAAAGLMMWSLSGGRGMPPEPSPAADAAVVAWEWDLLLGSELPAEDLAREGDLPDEFVAIAGVFLDSERW